MVLIQHEFVGLGK